MRGVRVAIFIHHGFCISMVRRDQHHTSHSLNFFHDSAHTFIHCLAGPDGCIQKAGMAHHVHIGKIKHYQLVCDFIQSGQQQFGYGPEPTKEVSGYVCASAGELLLSVDISYIIGIVVDAWVEKLL